MPLAQLQTCEPAEYIQRSPNLLKAILQKHFQSFSEKFSEKYNTEYGNIRLERFTSFKDSLNFIFIPIAELEKMKELFRRLVIKYFVDSKLLSQELANNLLSWKHSGFSIDNSHLFLKKPGELD